MCQTAWVPRVPTSPVTTAYVLYKAWRRLPPRQRRLLLEVARTHGPTVAARAVQMSKKRRRRSPANRLVARSEPAESLADDTVLLELMSGRVALAGTGAPGPPDERDRRNCRGGPARRSSRRWRIDRHAPMFCGSSCAHTIDSRRGYEAIERPTISSTGNGYSCSTRTTADRRRGGPHLVPDDVVEDLPRAQDEPAHGVVVGVRRRRARAGTSRSRALPVWSPRLRNRSRPFGVITTSGRAVTSRA